jgi:hypothetical protein
LRQSHRKTSAAKAQDHTHEQRRLVVRQSEDVGKSKAGDDNQLRNYARILGTDAVDEQAEDDAQDRSGKNRHCHHETLLLRRKMQSFTDLSSQRTEHGPNHEAEIEVEKCREQSGPVTGAFEIG